MFGRVRVINAHKMTALLHNAVHYNAIISLKLCNGDKWRTEWFYVNIIYVNHEEMSEIVELEGSSEYPYQAEWDARI